MSYPEYKQLNINEKVAFKKAWQERVKNSPFYPWLYKHINASISGFKIYFFICFVFLLFNSYTSLYFLFIAILGFVVAQILFALFHTRIHALFLEYDEWNVNSTERVMQTPIVSFYAFYHHHHTRGNNWLPELSYFDSKENLNGTNYIVLAHWYSFSFWYIASKLPFAMYLMIPIFYYSPLYSLAAVIGYEIGQFFIPVFHSYGHNVSHQVLGSNKDTPTKRHVIDKVTDGFNGLLFYVMKKIRLLATPRQHAVHHLHYDKTPFVYRSFSSSGIYAKCLDKLFDRYYIWSFQKLPLKAYDVMRTSALTAALILFLSPFCLAAILTFYS